MSAKKKVFMLIPPLSGHINPVSSVAYELVKRNFHVIFFGNDENRPIIEKTGAEFRKYVNGNYALIQFSQSNEKKSISLFYMWDELMKYSYELIPSFINEVEHEKPDLIIYDQTFLPAKYFLEVMKKSKTMKHKPPSVMFFPNFSFNDEIAKAYDRFYRKTIWTYMYIFLLYFKQFIFNLHFGIRIWHPLDMFMAMNDNLNIVAVLPELQPLRETFGEKIHFVGPCVIEEVRNYDNIEPELKEILDFFKPKTEKTGSISNEKLVYVSLGSIFHSEFFVFEAIIEAIRKIKDHKLKIVISVGDLSYDKFQHKIKQGYELPANVLLFKRVPQIEILKRASLFITHAGQNSASEAIQYNVPVICIPISADQPIVAHRMCDELKLGIRFEPLKLDVNKLSNAVDEMLTSKIYAENMNQMSETSKKYNGSLNAINLILDFLNGK